MLLLIIYILISAVIISKSQRRGLLSLLAVLTFVVTYSLFALIGYLLVQAGVVPYSPFYENAAVHGRYQAARFILGTLQIGTSIYAFYLIDRALSKARSEATVPRMSWKCLLPNVYWRLFVVLQVLGLVVLIYADLTSRSGWNFLPSFREFEWDIFEGYYWTRRQENWIALLCIVGPFATAKAIEWVRRKSPVA